jgi:hypothetical protein
MTPFLFSSSESYSKIKVSEEKGRENGILAIWR